MAFHITHEQMSRIAGPRGRRSTSSMLHTGKQTVEVLGAAGAWAYLQGRKNNNMPEVLGIPVDAGTGVLLHVLGLFNLGGAYNDDLHNLGDGSLAWWFGNWAAGKGKEAFDAQPQTSSTTVTTTTSAAGWGGAPQPQALGVGGPRLTPQQVAAMPYGASPFAR